MYLLQDKGGGIYNNHCAGSIRSVKKITNLRYEVLTAVNKLLHVLLECENL
jgi:hypothetical protein